MEPLAELDVEVWAWQGSECPCSQALEFFFGSERQDFEVAQVFLECDGLGTPGELSLSKGSAIQAGEPNTKTLTANANKIEKTRYGWHALPVRGISALCLRWWEPIMEVLNNTSLSLLLILGQRHKTQPLGIRPQHTTVPAMNGLHVATA